MLHIKPARAQLEAARELLERAGLLQRQQFLARACRPCLEVLPVGTAFSGVELPTDVAGAGNDFEAIEKLRRLAFADQVEEPKQLELWRQEPAQPHDLWPCLVTANGR